jgi:cobalt-zinc-cadmium efflux system membrane fusion protein
MKLITSVLILALWLVSPFVEDHGAAPATVAIGGAPRLVTHSDLFELVGIIDNGAMTVYLDRYADNSPVTDAKIEVEVGSEKGIATTNPNGTYRFQAKAFSKPSEMPVTFTIAAGNDADLLAGDLIVVDDHKEDAVKSSNLFTNKWIAGGSIAVLILIVASLLIRKRRHQTVGIFK